jgi:hypothetical protein
MDIEIEEKKKDIIVEGLGKPKPTTTDIAKRLSAIFGICLVCLMFLYSIMTMWVLKCKSLHKARVSMFAFHVGIMILLAIPFLVSHSIFLGEIKPNVTIMAAKLYAMVVIPTFILLEVPITGNFLNPLFENTLGISLLGILSGPGWINAFTHLNTAFAGTCWKGLAPGYSFPLTTILPLFNLNMSNGTFDNTDPKSDLRIDDTKMQAVCDNFQITFDSTDKSNITSLFELCVYKHSIGHTMWVLVSLMSASLAATYASF